MNSPRTVKALLEYLLLILILGGFVVGAVSQLIG
jgi:hypothetical protein